MITFIHIMYKHNILIFLFIYGFKNTILKPFSNTQLHDGR